VKPREDYEGRREERPENSANECLVGIHVGVFLKIRTEAGTPRHTAPQGRGFTWRYIPSPVAIARSLGRCSLQTPFSSCPGHV
jgi:hypothetical protein